MKRLLKALVPRDLREKLYPHRERLRFLLHLGSRMECPCCGQRYREFLPHGRPERRNALCYRCDAVERHRLLLLFLKDRTGIFSQPMSLLHFAPEKALRPIFAGQRNLRYVTTDYCEASDVHMDITRMAVADNTFDAVLCSHVLEHIPDDRAAMKELHRILKPNGWAILQVPLDTARENTYEDFSITAPEERRKHFGQEDHVRMYGRDYKQRLEAAGFQVSVENYIKTMDPARVKRHGLVEEDVYFCTKGTQPG